MVSAASVSAQNQTVAQSAAQTTGGASAQTSSTEVEPLSAIDWLSQTLITPNSSSNQTDGDITQNALPQEIETTSLDQQTADAVGLVPSSVTGFPLNFWGKTPSVELAQLFNTIPVETLPALQELTATLLLAELDPPIDATKSGLLFQSRIDKLLDIGALEQAAALLDRANVRTAPLFARSFDIALLTENETAACKALNDAADLAPTITARVFCLARAGDWNAAALIYETGVALGYVDEIEEEVLARFLDPEFSDNTTPLPFVARPSPLIFRLYSAVGEPVPTTLLPRAYAHTELTANNGWRPRIEAAERLTHSGAISPNILLALYTNRPPSASGGVWDRVEAIQRLDLAIKSGDPSAISATLPNAWAKMQDVDLEYFLAQQYGGNITKYPLQGEAAEIALKLALLSDDYEKAALKIDANAKYSTNETAFLVSLAKGRPALNGWDDPRAMAIYDGFSKTKAMSPDDVDIAAGNYGKVVLRALNLFAEGAKGDLNDVTRAIAILRNVGLEDVARRASLQLMLLERT